MAGKEYSGGKAAPQRAGEPLRSYKFGKGRTGVIHAHDRFIKVGDVLESSQAVWLVSHIVEVPGLPPHVKLVYERFPHRTQTFSVAALLDKRFFRRVSTPPRPAEPPVPSAAEREPEGDERQAPRFDDPAAYEPSEPVDEPPVDELPGDERPRARPRAERETLPAFDPLGMPATEQDQDAPARSGSLKFLVKKRTKAPTS